jgi:hypothetical protein
MKKMTRKKSKPKRGATKPPMGGLVIGLDGSSVEVDDIFAFVGARMKEADERVLPEQVAIRPGDFAIAGTSGELIFYRILDPLATAHPDELEELRKSYASKPHLRWVEGFSEI